MTVSMVFNFFIIIANLLVINVVVGEDIENLCALNDNCENCLSTNFNCTWCTDKDFLISERCSTKEILLSQNCSESHIIFNHEEIQIIQDNPIQDYQQFEGKSARAIQLQPQKMKIKLVKSHPQRFKLKYRPAKNNPLDLYYLMDLTWSMRDDKETLTKIGEELAEALKTLTENYRLGFGSFADKPTMPMTMPGAEKNPCAIERTQCEPTYGFRHHLALTNDIKEFVRKVNSSQVTGNLDNLEGGLDALMQVIVCTNQIGWSTEARKIVVLATDGFMHFAGDGILAGVTKRNDKQCHLNEFGEYDGTLVYDYPSLEEIYRELTRQKINVIFAVTQNVASSYYQLGDLMNEISSVEILSLDSSNILELIKKGHQTLIKKVQFEDTSPSNIQISYETNCGGLHDGLKRKNFCNSIQFGDEIEFYITITLKDYPDDEIYNHVIRIEEAGLSEFVEIDVELQKPCPCTEEAIEITEGRVLCNQHGNFQCGMCLCDDGWLGTTCSCDSGNYTTNRALEDECRKPIKTSTANNQLDEICSNHGDCDCGECHCMQGFVGKYCECEDCRGQCDDEREECICGECICKYGWSSDNKCNCRETNENCLSPKDETICSKRGQCVCGQCVCDETYLGRFCEIGSQSDNNNMLCEYYNPCVECLISQRQKQSSIECNENMEKICMNKDNQTFRFEFNENLHDNETKCLLRISSDDKKCDHYFAYDIDNSGTSFLKIKMQRCNPLNTAEYAGIGFLSTLIAGLFILVTWRLYFFIKDKREFAKFEADVKRTMTDKNTIEMESPLYKNPILVYNVPEYEEY